MSIAVPFAIRKALAAAREEIGIPSTKWFQIGEYNILGFRYTITYMKDFMVDERLPIHANDAYTP